jgi:hypothetical protein
VRLADSPAAFLIQVEAALAEGPEPGRAARQAEARRHSWSSRFEQFARLLDGRECSAALLDGRCACAS